MQNWKTDLFAYAKLALAAAFAYLKLSKGLTLTTEDLVLLGALGLGAGGSKVASDTKVSPP